MKFPTLKVKVNVVVSHLILLCVVGPTGLINFGIPLLQRRSVGLSVEYSSRVISVLNFDFYFC